MADQPYVPRLKQLYVDTVRPQLMEKFSYSNAMQVPRFDKVVLNMGVGEAVGDGKIINVAAEDLAKIAGQKPVITRARKSIATYKIRENMPIGVKVTLRQARMWEFIDRFINIALPRVRDFRGLSDRSFDGRDYDKIDRVWGFDVIICTTARNDEEARALLEAFNFPFRRQAARRQAA